MITDKNINNNELKKEKLNPTMNEYYKKEDYMYGGEIKVI